MKKWLLILSLAVLSVAKAGAQDHLLLSEICLQLSQAEFIEIYNPTATAISLENYYLADNQNYPYVPGTLPTLDPGDFIAHFPTGASISSHATLVIALNGFDFETHYAQKADFEIINGDAATPDMIIISEAQATLSNAGEGIALFYWNGVAAIVQDVDLMNAGIPGASSEIVDKSVIPGYLPDAHTMPYQSLSGPPGAGFSTKRIAFEGPYEIHNGGNGITGDDETSEDISLTWDAVYTSPTPGSTVLLGLGTAAVSTQGPLLNIYPNPAGSVVNIELEPPSGNCSVELWNTMGALLQSWSLPQDVKLHITENLSVYPGGAYLVILRSGEEVIVRRLLLY